MHIESLYFFDSIIIKILQFLSGKKTAKAISRAIMGKPLFEMVIGIFPYSTMISCGKESFPFLKPRITYKKNLKLHELKWESNKIAICKYHINTVDNKQFPIKIFISISSFPFY